MQINEVSGVARGCMVMDEELTPRGDLWRNKGLYQKPGRQPPSSWDHLTDLTFSPHWSITARVWAKVTIGFHPVTLRKPFITFLNLLLYSHSKLTEDFGFPLWKVSGFIDCCIFRIHILSYILFWIRIWVSSGWRTQMQDTHSHMPLNAVVAHPSVWKWKNALFHDSANENISSSKWNEHWRWCSPRVMQMSCAAQPTH